MTIGNIKFSQLTPIDSATITSSTITPVVEGVNNYKMTMGNLQAYLTNTSSTTFANTVTFNNGINVYNSQSTYTYPVQINGTWANTAPTGLTAFSIFLPNDSDDGIAISTPGNSYNSTLFTVSNNSVPPIFRIMGDRSIETSGNITFVTSNTNINGPVEISTTGNIISTQTVSGASVLGGVVNASANMQTPNLSVTTTATVSTGNVTNLNATYGNITNTMTLPVTTVIGLPAPGAVGQVYIISDSPTYAGRMAYWCTTPTAAWRYVDDNTAV